MHRYRFVLPGVCALLTSTSVALKCTLRWLAHPFFQPFLVLDARDLDEFHECHIEDALSYPIRLYNQDKVIPELFR